MTYSIATVTSQQTLTGLANGVRCNGAPGSPSNIYIRGFGNSAAAQPLYVVDGEVVSNLQGVDPNEIEGLSVLKDARGGCHLWHCGRELCSGDYHQKESGRDTDGRSSVDAKPEQSIRKNFSDYGYWQPKQQPTKR